MENQTENALVVVLDDKINDVVTSSKVDITKAQSHAIAFADKMQAVNELSKALSLMNKENPSVVDVKIARLNRLALVKVRTSTVAMAKERKSLLIPEEKLIDGLRSVVENSSILTEQEYEEIEKFYEKQENKRKSDLKEARTLLLQQYTDQANIYPLGEMQEESFKDLLEGFRLQKEAKDEAARKAEQDRKDAEEKKQVFLKRQSHAKEHGTFFAWHSLTEATTDEEYSGLVSEALSLKKNYEDQQEQIRLENEKLKAEKEEQEKQAAIIKALQDARVDQILPYNQFGVHIEMSTLHELSEDEFQMILEGKKCHFEESEKERLEKERLAAEEKEAQEKNLKAEKEKIDKLQKELADKKETERLQKEAEEKIIADEAAAKVKAAKAPDKEKLKSFISSFSIPEQPNVKGKEAMIVENEIIRRFNGFKAWAESEVEKI